MRAVKPRPREDYAPSRVAYRVNRLWLSPLIRWMALFLLPFCIVGGAVGWWAIQPTTHERVHGWWLAIEARLRSQPDFQVQSVQIFGASPDLAEEIRRVISTDFVQFPVSVLDLPTQAITDRIASFDAVQSVEARVELGGAFIITVTERTPVVVWRNQGGLVLLDITGHRVATTNERDGAADLPLISAAGADRAVPQALQLFAAAKPIAERVRGLVRQGERRWDVVLTRDQVIELPETDPVPALQRVIALQEAGQLLDRDVTVIDMRNPDRLTVRLGPDAQTYLKTLKAYQQGQTR